MWCVCVAYLRGSCRQTKDGDATDASSCVNVREISGGFERRPTHGKGGVHGEPAMYSRDPSKAQPQPGEALGIGFLPGALCSCAEQACLEYAENKQCSQCARCSNAWKLECRTQGQWHVQRLMHWSCCQTKGSKSTRGQLRQKSSSAILPNHRARTGVRTPIDSTRGGGGR